MATTTTTTTTRKTRGANGISVPRKIEAVLAPEPKKRAKANTSKPRSKVSAGRVGKTKAPTKTKKPLAKKIEDKVTGVVEKVEGKVEGKPGKKASGTAKIHGTKKPVAKTTKKKTVKV